MKYICWTAVSARVAADHILVSASSAYIGWLAHIGWKAYPCQKSSSARWKEVTDGADVVVTYTVCTPFSSMQKALKVMKVLSLLVL